MKNGNLKVSKRLWRAIVTFIASLVLCAGVCFAWFAVSAKVDGNGMATEFEGINIKNFSVKAYSLQETNGNLTVDSYLTGSKVEMQPYGGTIGTDNSTQALLLEISYEFKSVTGKKYNIYSGCDEVAQFVSKIEGKDSFTCHLSDAVKYNRATVSGVPAKGTAVTLVADSELSYLYQTENEDSESVYAKRTLQLNGDEITDSSSLTGKFYLVIDYDALYVAELYSAVLNADGTLNSEIAFGGDMNFYMQEML